MQKANPEFLKKRYIEWFMDTFALKEPEATRVLKYISDDDEILKKVHFVEDIRNLPNAILISAVNTRTVSFLCRFNDQYYENFDHMLDFLREEECPEDLFIRLSFDRDAFCLLCEKDFEPESGVKDKLFYYRVVRALEDELNDKIRDREVQRDQIMQEINIALAAGDRETFYKLSSIYNQIKNYN